MRHSAFMGFIRFVLVRRIISILGFIFLVGIFQGDAYTNTSTFSITYTESSFQDDTPEKDSLEMSKEDPEKSSHQKRKKRSKATEQVFGFLSDEPSCKISSISGKSLIFSQSLYFFEPFLSYNKRGPPVSTVLA